MFKGEQINQRCDAYFIVRFVDQEKGIHNEIRIDGSVLIKKEGGRDFHYFEFGNGKVGSISLYQAELRNCEEISSRVLSEVQAGFLSAQIFVVLKKQKTQVTEDHVIWTLVEEMFPDL